MSFSFGKENHQARVLRHICREHHLFKQEIEITQSRHNLPRAGVSAPLMTKCEDGEYLGFEGVFVIFDLLPK